MSDDPTPAAVLSASAVRRAIARRVADAHRTIGDDALLAFVSGSVVDDIADAKSDIDMSVIFHRLPAESALIAACRDAGGREWFWRTGTLHDDGMVVAFRLDDIEVQIGYSDIDTLRAQMNTLLIDHNPDTPLHKLAEGIIKAEPLAGADQLTELQGRLAAFPPELARAMVEHYLRQLTPWRAIAQLVDRDAALWCREEMVNACYATFGILAGLNRRYFTRFQFKRMRRLAASLRVAPVDLAARVETLLEAPIHAAFAQLYALEGEVLALVAAHTPEVDLSRTHRRRADFKL